MKVSLKAATQQVSDEFAKSHDVVRKARADEVARLSSALSQLYSTVVEETADA